MLNLQKMREEQVKLASKVLTSDQFGVLKLIGGADVAFTAEKIIGAVVTLSYQDLRLEEWRTACQDQAVPYIPGFLAYREMPVLVEAFSLLDKKPDVLMVHGNGILHPRRIGLASHLGLAIDTPTLGVATKLLCGEVSGGAVILDKEVVGYEIRTKPFAKPIYISPGHKVSLKSCLEIFNATMRGHKLPEPLKVAHRYAANAKKKTSSSNDPADHKG
ncbi:MAG: endonuclease V [Nanoarchaeota archaeon]